MRVVLIGTILYDELHTKSGEKKESPGGLFYSIQAARACLGAEDEIIPISFVGMDVFEKTIDFLGEDNRLNLAGLYYVKQPNNRVIIRYHSEEERREQSVHPLPPLRKEHVSPFLDADIWIVNFISGWDIDIQAYRELAVAFRGMLSVDIHSLTLRRDSKGFRHQRRLSPDQLEAIIGPADIIQCNRKEFTRLFQGEWEEFYLAYCFNKGKIFNLTLGRSGSITFYRVGNKSLSFRQEGRSTPKVVDPTGCGDVFLTIFATEYVRHGDVSLAAEKANLIAARSGSVTGLPKVSVLIGNSKIRN